MYSEITYDTYNICKRLKYIDKNYFIRFNHKTAKYEVWYNEGINSHLEIVIPYKSLDCRVISKILNSRVNNIEKILKDISLNNKRLEEKSKLNFKDELNYKVKLLLK